MGRKKKNQNEEDIQEEKDWQWDIKGDVKKSLVAVFLSALGVIIILGFFEKSGIVGGKIGSGIALTVGWMKWLFPLFLFGAAIILLIKEKTSFYVWKIVGLFAVLFSTTSLLHWFYPLKEMGNIAASGIGGGYLGFSGAYLAVKFLGEAGGLVVILGILVSGLIFTFNFSLLELVARFKKRTDEAPNLSDNKGEEKNSESEKEEIEIKEKDAPEDEKGNIAKIEFVEGADQYVDKDLEKGSKTGFPIRKMNHGKSGKKSMPSGKGDDWELPPLDNLEKGSGEAQGGDTEKNAQIIQKTLKNFGINVEPGEIKTGPSVTQYSFRPAVGVKISKILSFQDDIALALAAHPIRIEAPIPGKSMVGIEVPNKVSTMVRLRDILESQDFFERKSNLTVCLGKDVSGNFELASLDKMPHLLVAGATGTGKSVCVNSIITSLLYQNSPRDLKFIMVDPKRVELSLYNGIPHLLSEVIVENGKVVSALKWAVGEMERRYRLLQDTGSRDLNSYNE
ncbi:MAG: DNA translocase FtsK 4TM domain-containing protein, partial [Patescibacteria group bacterium]